MEYDTVHVQKQRFTFIIFKKKIEVAILRLKDEEMLMIHQLAKGIATYFMKENIIEREDMDTYIYGAEVLISGIVGIINIMILSIIINSFWNGVLFLIIFIPIRMYTGGYHASSYLTCNIWFVLIYFLILQAVQFTLKWSLIPVIWVGVILGFMIIVRYAPLENINKKIPMIMERKYKKIGCLLYISFMVIANILCMKIKIFNYIPVSVETGVYINIVLVTIAILFVVGMRKERKNK